MTWAFASSAPRTRRIVVVVAWALGLAAFVAAPWVPPFCPTRLVFHVPCPSCGLTRAARLLAEGDVGGATRMHPLWWLVFPYVAVALGMEARSYVRSGKVDGLSGHPGLQRAGVWVLIALVIVWIVRGLGGLGGPAPV